MGESEAGLMSGGVKLSPAVYYVGCLLVGFGCDLALGVEPSWPRWARTIGGVLIAAGVGVVATGLGWLRRSGTTIDPHKAASVLVVSGLYRVSRNPAYLGWCFIYVGVAFLGGSIASLSLLPVAMGCVQHFAIRREEAYLQQAFGEAYAQYRSRVRRWI